MGIIKAAIGAIGGGLADSWLEVIEPSPMSKSVIMVPGKKVQDGRSSNTKGTDNLVSNGSAIHVYENQAMLLIDNGKVVDFTAEPGMYTVDHSSAPSLFCGQFGDSIKETFNRIRFGGTPSSRQRVIYLNLSEITNIRFGTSNPVQYFDNFYNAELFIRAHGTYSMKVTDPLKFYAEVVPQEAVMNNQAVDFQSLAQQYVGEFTTALSSAINQYSADGNRVSYVQSKQRELGRYMAQTLDEEWNEGRGMEVCSVALEVSYDDESKALIAMRNKGAMLSDAAVQQGYVAANISEGLKDAGSNSNGAMAGFMGMGMGMNMGGNILGGYQQNPQYHNQQPMQQGGMPQQPQQPVQQPQQAPAQPAQPQGGADSWTCTCGAVNKGKFCPECGGKKPEAPKKRFCSECGAEIAPNAKFCPECGAKNS